jgi:hypothetical protein
VAALEKVIQNATGGAHPLDLSFIDEEDLATPWQAGLIQSFAMGWVLAGVAPSPAVP